MGSSVVGSGAGTAFSHGRQAVLSTAVQSFSTAYITGPGDTDKTLRAKRVLISVETSTIRATWDGSTPTTGFGHKLGNGDVFILEGYANIANFKFIETVGTTAFVEVTAER